MEKPRLIIQVIGSVNTGKTTVATLIKNMLDSHGIKTTVNDLDDDFPCRDIKSCTEALADKGLEVGVQVVQANRAGQFRIEGSVNREP